VSAALQIEPDDAPCYTRRQVRDAVHDEIMACLGVLDRPKPALLTQGQLAEQLQISDRTVFELRKRGMPVIWVCESPRYELASCIGWLRGQGKETQP
jgi:hypothetical protein